MAEKSSPPVYVSLKARSIIKSPDIVPKAENDGVLVSSDEGKPKPKVFSTIKKGNNTGNAKTLDEEKASSSKKKKEKKEEAKAVVEATPATPTLTPVPAPKAKVERKPVPRPKPLVKKDPVRLEIDQLKIRFPDLTETTIDDGILVIEAVVPILDPEFPFDLPTVHLQITIPKGYPNTDAASFAILNPEIPANLKAIFKGHMDRTSRSLIGQEALRPMLRFMEKNLEQMLTPPANTGGFKFIAPTITGSPVAPRPLTVIEMEPLRRPEDDKEMVMPLEYLEALQLEGISESSKEARSSTASPLNVPEMTSLPLKKQVESRFGPPEPIPIEPIPKATIPGTIQLLLQQTRLKGIGLLLLTQLGLSLKCDRCKVATPIPDLRPNLDRIYACRKCTSKGTVHFYMDALHEGSRVAGYLRCKGGVPLELLPSTFQMTCGTCCPPDENPSASTTRVTGVQVGELVSMDCRHCHREMSMEIGKVDWIAMPGLGPATKGKVASQKLPSAIGEPLPNHGACKHYKKSFRWFRFPCCGKAYPCDSCHDEDPLTDHKSEWATRMICGDCSREMPIGTKECACGAAPGTTRRSTHWEGGKGMRDQTQMSRKDSKKYRNLTKPQPAKKD